MVFRGFMMSYTDEQEAEIIKAVGKKLLGAKQMSAAFDDVMDNLDYYCLEMEKKEMDSICDSCGNPTDSEDFLCQVCCVCLDCDCQCSEGDYDI